VSLSPFCDDQCGSIQKKIDFRKKKTLFDNDIIQPCSFVGSPQIASQVVSLSLPPILGRCHYKFLSALVNKSLTRVH